MLYGELYLRGIDSSCYRYILRSLSYCYNLLGSDCSHTVVARTIDQVEEIYGART